MNSTIRRSLVRVAALALPVMAVACLSGHDNPSSGIGQIIGPDSSGAGGTSGGSVSGTYKLSTFNGNALPDTIINVNVSIPSDSARLILAVLDSAQLILDTNGLAFENDFFQLTDQRSGPGLIPATPTFSFSTIGGGDEVVCVGGTYSDSLVTQTTFQLQGQVCGNYGSTYTVPTLVYAVGGDSLVGTEYYQFVDTTGIVLSPTIPASVSLVWKFFSAATDQRQVSAPAGKVMKARHIVVKHN